jgi:hypothetical protein
MVAGTKGIVTKYLADTNGGSRRILRPDCRSGISRICWKIDCQGELNRLRTINHRRVAIDRSNEDLGFDLANTVYALDSTTITASSAAAISRG